MARPCGRVVWLLVKGWQPNNFSQPAAALCRLASTPSLAGGPKHVRRPACRGVQSSTSSCLK